MLEAGERDGHLGFSSEQSLGMPGRGGHGEPPVQGFSLFQAAPASPLWTTNIWVLRTRGGRWISRVLQPSGSSGPGCQGSSIISGTQFPQRVPEPPSGRPSPRAARNKQSTPPGSRGVHLELLLRKESWYAGPGRPRRAARTGLFIVSGGTGFAIMDYFA